MRGTSSIANEVTFAAASAATVGSSEAGDARPTVMVPAGSVAASSGLSGRTWQSTSKTVASKFADELRAGLLIGRVRVPGGQAGAGFDGDVDPESDELGHRLRCCCDTFFAVSAFTPNANLHEQPLL